MTVRNGMPFLSEAMDSILIQDLADFEVVVVDDASADGTADYLRGLGDGRVRVLSRPNSAGIASALNFGLDACRGELIARMDADDIADPSRLAVQARYMQMHPDVALLGCAVQPIHPDGTSNGTAWLLPVGWPMIRWRLYFTNAFAHPSVMFRRALVQEVGGYAPEYEGAEDYELWLRLARRHQLANLPDPLLRYRVHPQSVSQSRSDASESAARLAAWHLFNDDLGRTVSPRAVARLRALLPWQSMNTEASLRTTVSATALLWAAFRNWHQRFGNCDAVAAVRNECIRNSARLSGPLLGPHWRPLRVGKQS